MTIRYGLGSCGPRAYVLHNRVIGMDMSRHMLSRGKGISTSGIVPIVFSPFGGSCLGMKRGINGTFSSNGTLGWQGPV